jgi:hypothetical protein
MDRLITEEKIRPLREQIFGTGVEINNQIRVFLELCLIVQDLTSVRSIIDYLEEPCLEHDRYLLHCKLQSRYEHRRLCPKCLQDLRKGEK